MAFWFSLICLAGWTRWRASYRRYALWSAWSWPQWSPQRALLKLGVPIALSYFVEVTAFTSVALLIANLGAQVVASHQVVPVGQPVGRTAGDRLDLAQLAGNEALPAEPRIDAHHQHQIDVLKHIVQHLGGRRWVERHARFLAKHLDLLNCAMKVRASGPTSMALPL